MSPHKSKRNTPLQYGTITKEEKTKNPDFTHRESPLTVLVEHSLHIRAIYHIFVVILLVLLSDTVMYDLVERGEQPVAVHCWTKASPRSRIALLGVFAHAGQLGWCLAGFIAPKTLLPVFGLCIWKPVLPRVNIGVTLILYAFGDIKQCAKLWLFELAVALAFYPGLKIYVAIRKIIKDYPGFRRVWSITGIISVIALEILLIAVPLYDLAQTPMALGSSAIVTCEMFRFVMKICAVAVAFANRCKDRGEKLPTFSHFVYFLFAPTLLYRDEYPRTKRIRWGVVAFHLLEVTAIVFYESFLWERFIMPYWSNYGKVRKVEIGTVVRGILSCVLPGISYFLCGFYCFLHSWLNAFAEMLKFGDRLFYEDWWTSSRFVRYYRTWNRVVHFWLRDHIHRPLTPYIGRNMSIFVVFFVSALAHEVVFTFAFGFFYPVIMVEFAFFGQLFLHVTDSSGSRYPNVFNIIMWLLFFCGNGLLFSLYPMEYYARKNCPQSETDSFFIPKSWSCPEIILNPNWTFQNPLLNFV